MTTLSAIVAANPTTVFRLWWSRMRLDVGPHDPVLYEDGAWLEATRDGDDGHHRIVRHWISGPTLSDAEVARTAEAVVTQLDNITAGGTSAARAARSRRRAT